MPLSDAQILANRANSLKSTGPRTVDGKDASRRNGLKHGLAGQGVVMPESEQAAIDRLADSLLADLRPRSPMGIMMIPRLALLSVRMERAGKHELAAVAYKVRHAADDFDEERLTRADTLYDDLDENPWGNLRRLKKSPEGAARLIQGWRELLEDITREGRGSWTAAHLERAVLMTGTRGENARTTRLGDLSRGVWGDFYALADSDGKGLGEEPRQAWCRARLAERIQAEIAALESHRETLDLEMIALDRSEAGARALFDESKGATLARRYEAAAERSFYKALKEFRQAEADFEARAEAPPDPSPAYEMASSGEWDDEDDEEPDEELRNFAEQIKRVARGEVSTARGANGPASNLDKPLQRPR